MERSRLSKKLLRHSPRNQTCRHSRGYLYALITLLLFCMLVFSHSKLSAANASNFARLFIAPITQRESSAPNLHLLKPANLPPRNETGFREVAERKLGEAQSRNGSLLLRKGRVEDEDMDTGTETDADVAMEEDLSDNAEEEGEEQQQQQKEEEGVERDHQKGVGGGGWHGVSLSSSMHRADKMSTGVKDRTNTGKVLPGSPNGELQPKKFLYKQGAIKTLPRWDPLENIGDRGKPGSVERDDTIWRSPRLSAIKWDHLLGVLRRVGSLQSSSNRLESRKVKIGAQHAIPSSPKDSPFMIISDSASNNTDVFGSDDEPLDQNVRDNLEEIATIEDALLLRIEKGKTVNLHSWADKRLKGDAYKKERSNKGFLELLNPMNNPLLQDPDTSNPNGLSGNDRAMLKALRRASAKVGSLVAEQGNRDPTTFQRVSQDMLATREGAQSGTVAERSILELSSSNSIVSSEDVGRRDDIGSSMSKKPSPFSELSSEKRPKSFLDTRKWGFYPGLDSNLAFSDFMEQFLGDEKCSHRVFMVWTTPPWTYTVRYQRGLESIFYFHPQACVVVFSISIELDFFMSFVEQGFRVAVVVPNLEELLAGTPADVFSSFWLPWRKTHFFYIHYSELLRLAALYKYGGIYLDTDVVLLKPLVLLHNTIGAEKVENEVHKLNGAVMAFDKNSVFLLECLVEFTATYDDQLLEFNGAGLVTRVANRMANEQKKISEHFTGDLWIEGPHAFFPLDREDITRYFKAPDSKDEQLETGRLADSIYNQSSMLHFWNQKTHFLVPEASSLVERILNRHCIKCDEYL